LDNEGDISPVEVMEAAIAGPEYQKLVVLDWLISLSNYSLIMCKQKL
jgi:hypothetical protein